MAKPDKMPNQAIIDGFKGVLDFYYWKRIAVARRWPRYFARQPTPAEATNQNDFAYINKLYRTLPSTIIDALTNQALGTTQTPKDYLVRAYLKGLFELMPPEYYMTEATGLIILAQLQLIQDWLHPDNVLIAYNDRYTEETTIAGAGPGVYYANATPVPPGEIWVVTHLSVRHSDPANRASYILIEFPTNRQIAIDLVLPQNQMLDRQGTWLLKEGDRCRARFDNLAAATTGFLYASGYKMKL